MVSFGYIMALIGFIISMVMICVKKFDKVAATAMAVFVFIVGFATLNLDTDQMTNEINREYRHDHSYVSTAGDQVMVILSVICMFVIPVIITLVRKKAKEINAATPVYFSGRKKIIYDAYSLASLDTEIYQEARAMVRARIIDSPGFGADDLLIEYEITKAIDKNRKILSENVEDLYQQSLSVKENIIEWERQTLRPELIKQALIYAMDHGQMNALNSEKKEKLKKQLCGSKKMFDYKYKHLLDIKQGYSRDAQKRFNEETSNITTEGLGFGIITNSVGSAVAYDLLDGMERKKQDFTQRAKAGNRQIISDKVSTDSFCKNVFLNYEEYMAKVKSLFS